MSQPPNDILNSSAVFCRAHYVPYKHTDHATCDIRISQVASADDAA